MIVCKKYFEKLSANVQRGETITEVVLAVAVVIALSPFMYNQIIEMSKESQDIAKANKIVSLRDNVINYVRVNQSSWGENAEIKLDDEELKKISADAHSAYIDKYKVNGASITDVYLAFDIDESDYRSANIAKQIGEDAAVVREDGVAYSQSWAVSAPDDFYVGDLIFRISYDFEGSDKSRFLHRATMGEDKLNQMQRNLHMNNFNVFNAAKIDAVSAKITDVDAVFLESDVVDANNEPSRLITESEPDVIPTCRLIPASIEPSNNVLPLNSVVPAIRVISFKRPSISDLMAVIASSP